MIVEDQSQTIAFLADSASYAEFGAAGPVERLDTHTSIVFLAGDRAYKLKRAVRFSYLDYSTVERRLEACQNELVLNRRTAPRLYLKVRRICRAPNGRLAFGGSGPTVDCIVVMRRFEQSALFDDMARRGALTRPLMRDLADHIASFHHAAEIDLRYGGRVGLLAVIQSNASNLALAGPGIFDAEVIESLTKASTAIVERSADFLEGRRRSGKVRLCHGDLHLRNICLIDARPTLFDCVEFSRAIATIDVLYDLSFLLMDLQHRRLGDLSNLVFNRYFDREEEVEGAGTLPLFMSMHAAIRAHVQVAAMAAQLDELARERLAGEAGDYLALATSLLGKTAPRLIAVGGFSGTGKSTLAMALAQEVGQAPGARVLRSDVIRKRMMGVAPETPLPAEAYTEAINRGVYASLMDEGRRLLAVGHSVIADAVCARPEERGAMAELALGQGCPFTGLWLEAPPGLLEARLGARVRDASDATADVLREQLHRGAGIVEWHHVDAAKGAEAVLQVARNLLDAVINPQ